ncbi:DNase I-like protein [Rhizophagus irregularis]|uniref:DNase I-like protein n=1 Tax=Rhizophagus irregularis TaxID=588596 RepID=A0A2N0QVG2_9GLOM|nr:DNase I-like protein [Rhizophagus irregularis]
MEYTNTNNSVGVENQLSVLVPNNFSISSSKKQKNQKNTDKQKAQKNNDSNFQHHNSNLNDIPNEEHLTNLHVVNTDNNYFIDYLKIGTINIQGGYKMKKTDIINYFITHNFNILGITETQFCFKHDNKLIERYPHPINKNLAIYIILDANGDNRGSGVGLILTCALYQHVHQIKFHKGLVLNIELGFKKNHKLNITCLYLPAGRDKHTNIVKKDCNQFIDQLFSSQQGLNDNSKKYSIIMGDFNCYPKEKNNLNYHIIDLAKLKGLKDMAKYHAINQQPDITRTSHRIDYIFGNANILNVSIHTFTQPVPPSHFNSDHKAVITLLQNDLFHMLCSRSHHRYRKNDSKEKPDYSQMNDQLWDEYKDISKTYFNNRFRYIDLSDVKTQDDLDHSWNIFENSVQHIKKLIIPQKKI